MHGDNNTRTNENLYKKYWFIIKNKAKMRLYLYILFTLASHNLYSQLLTVDETATFLSNYLNKELSSQENIYGGKKQIQISTNDNNNVIIRYIWTDNEDALFPDYLNTTINYNELEINVSKIESVEKSFYLEKPTVIIKCEDGTKNCVKMNEEALMWSYADNFSDRPKAVNHFDYVHLYYAQSEKDQEIFYNALTYIIYELLRKSNERDIENPFSDGNLSFNKNKKEVIPLYESGGVSMLGINLGSVEVNAILDSGASDISIPESLESILLKNNIISEKDYLQPGLYAIADGSIKVSSRFIVPYIIVDGIRVNKVQCSTNESDNIVLLGKSFLNRFKSWKIENEFNHLILEY